MKVLLSIIFTLRVYGSLEKTDLDNTEFRKDWYFESTDFGHFPLWEGGVVLKEIIKLQFPL